MMEESEKTKFKELAEKKERSVKSLKESGDFEGIKEFSFGIYKEPAHFVYEILQNSEDSGANEAKIELFEDRFDAYNNGRAFKFEDVRAITTVKGSTKAQDQEKIGKFGIGFKSVFVITKTPRIYSGKYKFEIEDFMIPRELDENRKVPKTLISLPFNHENPGEEELSKEKAFELIKKSLKNLDLKNLLFLKNIKEVKWKIGSEEDSLRKESEKIGNSSVIAEKVKLKTSGRFEEYVVLKKPIQVKGKELFVEAAFRLGKNKEGKKTIVGEQNSKLFVYFQTEKDTYLNFAIQGPYKVTLNRENIKVDLSGQNDEIIELTGELVAESLSFMKEHGFLNIDFLNVLPIEEKNGEIYPVIYEKVKEKFLSGDFLPTSDGKFANPKECLLARGKGLTEFLREEDLQEIFSKKYWLDTNITFDRTKMLRDYLTKELEIDEIEFEDFARKITGEFLQNKSDEWMINFYGRCLDQRGSWEILKKKPIIRLDDNSQVSLYSIDQGRIYLPSESKSNYKTVKKSLTKDKKSLEFLKELGLEKPDNLAEVKEHIIPKYEKSENIKIDEYYYDDFKKILEVYDKDENYFRNVLPQVCFVLSVKNNDDKKLYLSPPNKLYFNSNDLKKFFEGYEEAQFVSEELLNKFGKDKIKKFLKQLDVVTEPRRVEVEGELTSEEKKELKGDNTSDYPDREEQDKCTDYEYEGLENFMQKITFERSCLLWKLLLRSISEHSQWINEPPFFEASLEWFYRTQRSERFDSKFLKTLQQTEWLFDKNNKMKKPADITFSQLHDDYEKNNSQVLKENLKFKPDILEQLSEDEKATFEKGKKVEEYGLTDEDLKKAAEAKDQEKNKGPKGWEPEVEVEDLPVPDEIEEENPAKIIIDDLSNQPDSPEGTRRKKPEEAKPPEREVETLADKKAKGEYGEKIVHRALKRKYKENEGYEVRWMNENGIGVGYDFCVKKDGKEIKYIEVKSRTEENPNLLEVQGTQWDFARKLFEQNKGEKFFIYVVSNIGKKPTKIKSYKNPFRLWKEGRIHAHPVNLKL